MNATPFNLEATFSETAQLFERAKERVGWGFWFRGKYQSTLDALEKARAEMLSKPRLQAVCEKLSLNFTPDDLIDAVLSVLILVFPFPANIVFVLTKAVFDLLRNRPVI